MYAILKNKTQRAKDLMTDFTCDLIRTPSGSLDEHDIALRIERKMKELDYDRVFRDDAGNVIGVIYGTGNGPTVVLNAHMDTVIPNEGDGWIRDPYSGIIENGRIYGAGATDCKSGLVSQIFAGAVLKHSLLPLKGNLVVAATVAEENGRSLGIRALMDETLPELGLKPDYFILGEPTNLGLHYGHDGWVQLDIRVEGDQPFHVEDVANGIYRDLEEGSFDQVDPDGGESFSVTPPEFSDEGGQRRASIGLSRKIRQGEDFGSMVHNLKKNASYVADNYGSVAVKVDVKQENQQLYTGRTVAVRNIVNAWSTDPFHPVIERSRQTLAAAGCPVQPRKWNLNRLEMGTAGSVLVNEYNIPTVGYGPGHIEAAHAVDEWVEVNNIPTAAYGAAAMTHGLVGYPVFGWTADEI